ncbi:Arginine utilization regulatory protein rocR (fragment) [Desulfamplus magnetovallimortis]|uniref:Arginine utilization regulatory protein rocR n=2 Tax=Desulfamplus magnetovallimortis TaxID=1246637 RepID=A0A1W1HGH2_9BACT
MAVNCAAIPDDLLEGLLFGTTRGAFTGALDKAGLFEMANGGTLFLDELLSMPIHLQAKLLRVIQEQKIRRLGSEHEIDINIKIISSVCSDPRIAVQKNNLRIDLFYRLGVVHIKIPPLRERREGMAELVSHFIEKLNHLLGTHVKNVSEGVMELFMAYHWPGNVRELEHLMEGAMNLVGHEETIELKHFSPGFNAFPIHVDEQKENEPVYNKMPAYNALHEERQPLEEGLTRKQDAHEKEAVSKALDRFNGNVTKAAKHLGISRQLLHYKIKNIALKEKTLCNYYKKVICKT